MQTRGDFMGARAHAAPPCACSAALAFNASAIVRNMLMIGRRGWLVAKPISDPPEASRAPGRMMRRAASDGGTSGALWARVRRLLLT